MPARTGHDYLQSIAHMKRSVYLHGRRIADVGGEAAFQGTLQTVAELYDLQHDLRFRDFMLYPSPSTGDPVHVGFQPARAGLFTESQNSRHAEREALSGATARRGRRLALATPFARVIPYTAVARGSTNSTG